MPEPIRRPDASLRALAHGLLAIALGSLVLSLPIAQARAACTPDPPADDDDVTCDGTDSTGYDASGATGVTITTTADAILDDSSATLDSAILLGDESTVTISDGATVRVTEQNGYGIRGDDDNFVDNHGLIEVLADDARGISIDQNTNDILPNGAVNSASGTIQVDGARGYAIESGDNVGVANLGAIALDGDETRGLSGGSRIDYTKQANVTNLGTITVTGDDAFGMKFGDGWLDGADPATSDAFDPTSGGIRNLVSGGTGGTIDVLGDRSFGIFVGDEANTNGDHDSFVVNTGTIDATGVDSIAVSLGGNDRLGRFDLSTLDLIDFQFLQNGSFDLFSLDNGGTISGGADAGPLVEFRDFVADNENLLLNRGSLIADLTNQGTPDRGVAIRGSDGEEFVVNLGEIVGDVELLGGDDRYLLAGGGGSQQGSLRGGSGQDELILVGITNGTETFDVSTLEDFETIRIQRGGDFSILSTGTTFWQLENAGGFTGLVEVSADGFLDVTSALTLGGDLSTFGGGGVRVTGGVAFDVLGDVAVGGGGVLGVLEGSTMQVGGDFDVAADGTVALTVDGATPPLHVDGAATLAGNLVVRQGDNLTPSDTPYRVLLADGGRTGQFANVVFPDASGTRLFTASYDALGVLALFQEVGLVGIARNSNQRSIAQYLVDLSAAAPGNQGDVQDLLDEIEDIQNIPAVYDALSPEGYDAQTTVSIEAGRKLAALLFDRPRECKTGEFDPWKGNRRVLPCHARRLAPWASILGSFRSRDAFSGHERYDAQMGGLVAGVDFAPIGGLDLSLAVSGQRGTVNVAGGGESTLTLAELTGAAAWNLGGLRVQGAVTWGHGFHQDRRQIKFAGAAPETSVNVRGTDDHESDRTLVASEIGYRIPAGRIGVEPLVGFDWAWISQDAVREQDAGGFSLLVDDRDDEVGSVRAGVRLSTLYEHEAYLGPWLEWMTGTWRPTFDVAWRQFVAGNERDLTARLAGGVDTVDRFRIRAEEDAGGAEIGFGLRLIPKETNRLRFDVRYQAWVAEHTLDQDLVGQVTLAF
ncbi:MAG: autotransporter outer membrane beta-barrel domain-containing protein [Myxococcota bacterium]